MLNEKLKKKQDLESIRFLPHSLLKIKKILFNADAEYHPSRGSNYDKNPSERWKHPITNIQCKRDPQKGKHSSPSIHIIMHVIV